MTERLHFHFSLSCTGEGNGNPLQCSWSLGGHTESDTTEATEQQQQQLLGFPGGASGKEPACQSRRHETQVQSCVKKIPNSPPPSDTVSLQLYIQEFPVK